MQLFSANDGQSVLSPNYWRLNDLQTAFFLEDDHCLLVACPGAGKTRTVVAKVARQCSEWGPSSVMAITFTRAGAKELRERLALALPATTAKAIKAYTFHGLAYRQLSSRQNVKLINAGDQYGLLSRARERVGCELSMEKLAETISTYQRTLDVRPPDESAEEFKAYQVYLEYRNTMAAHGVMDMDDMLRSCLGGYRAGSLKPYPVRAMLVDEFQDIDEIQLNFILEYAKRGTKIHVVGDDDQSIYAFRSGLGHAGMQRFSEALQAKIYFLDTNYRCAPEIVAVANRVIQRNSARMEKQLLSGASAVGSIQLLPCESLFDEAEAIVNHYQASNPTDSTMAVLARTNTWLDTIELAAVSRAVPVKRTGEQGFLQRKHISNVIAAVKLGLNPDDRLALISALFGRV